MPVIDLNPRRRRMREHQQRIAESIQFNQRMRQFNTSNQRMQRMIDENAAAAVKAEQEGRHEQAVQLAAEARRLQTFLDSSRSVCGKIEQAHVMTETNRAMTDMMKSASEMSDAMLELADPAVMGEIQAGMIEVDESMRYLKEQNDLALEAIDGDSDQTVSAEGEAYLSMLMNGERKQKKSRLLEDTNKHLDRLQRARPMD